MKCSLAYLSLGILLPWLTSYLDVNALATYYQPFHSGLDTLQIAGETLAARDPNAKSNQLSIYFVRHGDTDWSQQQIIQGQSDVPLNAHGVDHAHEMGMWMASLPIAMAYTSPRRRTQKTLSEISETHDTTFNKETDARLLGQEMGELTGKPYSVVDWTKPELIDEYKGVEPRAAMVSRLEEFLAEIVGAQVKIARHNPQGYHANIVIVGHGTTIIPMIRRLRKAGGESDESLDAALPPYYACGTIPIVTIDGLAQTPILDNDVVDWQAAQQRGMRIRMIVESVDAPFREE